MASDSLHTQLNEFVKQILFSALGYPCETFCVYECATDVLPEVFKSLHLSHEYLICFQPGTDGDAKSRLTRFLQKEIIEISHDSKSILYWFEGDMISVASSESAFEKVAVAVEPNRTEVFETLKTETHLPSWLDKMLFEELGALYAPDFIRYESNLDLSDDEIKVYLGTYFPRSYAEAFCIFDNIFYHKAYRTEVCQPDINILDVGAGTGGNLIGLLVAINKHHLANSTVNIYAIDGNERALAVLSKIVDKYRSRCNFLINLSVICQDIVSISELDLLEVPRQMDFVLSFKMGCEIIAKGDGTNGNAYYHMGKTLLPYLSGKGLLTLLDVTTKNEHLGFYHPVLMNSQLRKVIQEEADEYRTLIPLSCNQFEKECDEFCFTQRIFRISHKQKNYNNSKVSYRIIGRTEFIDRIVAVNDQSNFVLMPNRLNGNSSIGICPKSKGKKRIDGYKL